MMNFLKYYLNFENKEMIRNFDAEVAQLTNNSKNMGTEEYLLQKAKGEGIEEGLEKGLKKGLEKGLEKGKLEKAIEIARTFKNLGISSLDISKGTGLSIEEIEKL